jgi:catechol-2,3-dioxygenase
MTARINHVSVNARDLEESVDFYVELPGDVVQLYLRDPAGNLIEIDHEGANRLPDDIRAQIRPLRELNPQSAEQLRGRLFMHG